MIVNVNQLSPFLDETRRELGDVTKQKCCACSKFRSAKVYFRLAENKNTYELVVGAGPGHQATSTSVECGRPPADNSDSSRKGEKGGKVGKEGAIERQKQI